MGVKDAGKDHAGDCYREGELSADIDKRLIDNADMFEEITQRHY